MVSFTTDTPPAKVVETLNEDYPELLTYLDLSDAVVRLELNTHALPLGTPTNHLRLHTIKTHRTLRWKFRGTQYEYTLDPIYTSEEDRTTSFNGFSNAIETWLQKVHARRFISLAPSLGNTRPLESLQSKYTSLYNFYATPQSEKLDVSGVTQDILDQIQTVHKSNHSTPLRYPLHSLEAVCTLCDTAWEQFFYLTNPAAVQLSDHVRCPNCSNTTIPDSQQTTARAVTTLSTTPTLYAPHHD